MCASSNGSAISKPYEQYKLGGIEWLGDVPEY